MGAPRRMIGAAGPEQAIMSILKMTDLDLRGKRVLVRADLNVPQDESGAITDDTRIRASLAGIRHALDAGARLMVTSHLGRPKEEIGRAHV